MSLKYYLFIICLVVFLTPLFAQQLSISHNPAKPYIEVIKASQYCNVDLIVGNQSSDSLFLDKITLSVWDSKGNLLQKKFLDNNGTAPSIHIIPNRVCLPESNLLIFNPFPEFPQELPIHKFKFELVFIDLEDNEITTSKEVFPMPYKQPIDFSFPLNGRIMVYDGHDFNAHHRRFNYDFAPIKGLGFKGNPMRYAYDFVLVDNNGQQFKNQGTNDKDWLSFSAEVKSVAKGKVAAIVMHQLDDKTFNIPELKSNPLALYGNYVVIEHAPNLYSIYAHLQQNSSTLKTGDMVTGGQIIGKIGVSGSSFFPHLHFEIREGLEHGAEGLPSYFSNFSFIYGANKLKVKQATVNTGDIIEN